MTRKVSRRRILHGCGAMAAGFVSSRVFAEPMRAAAPDTSEITDALIRAARAEGRVSFYTALDLPVAEKLARDFESRYPGIAVRLERGGSERLFQRIDQEQASRIFAADVVSTSDAAHYLTWKRKGWLAPFLPNEVAQHYPAEHRDPDGMFATMRAVLVVIGYNTVQVTKDEAPKGFGDLLDAKWTGKIVKSHPAYSGTALSATHQIVRELGWDYLEKLSRQKVMQVQSANDTPKKIALGERAIMADGNEYTLLTLKDAGQAVDVVYPIEGTPFVTGPSAVFTSAPNPNAARLLQSYLLSRATQQLLADLASLRSLHGQTTVKAGRIPLAAIKLMKEEPSALEAEADTIKQRYAAYFRV